MLHVLLRDLMLSSVFAPCHFIFQHVCVTLCESLDLNSDSNVYPECRMSAVLFFNTSRETHFTWRHRLSGDFVIYVS